MALLNAEITIFSIYHSEFAKNLKYYNFDVIKPDSSQAQNDKINK